jgi:hypothetical protein
MFRSGKTQAEPVVVIRDCEQVESDLRRALETAEAGERAGLEKALRIVAETSSTSEEQVRRRWAQQILRESGLDVRYSVEAVKALRTAKPGLSLTAAVQLAKEAAE